MQGNDNPLQYSCLENSMDRGAWWVLGVTKSRTRLSDLSFTFTKMQVIVLELFCYMIQVN